MKKSLLFYALRLFVAVGCILMVVFSPVATLSVAAQTATGSVTPTTNLSKSLLSAVQNAQFNQVIDYGPYGEACPGKNFCPSPALPIANAPNVDIAVIQLDRNGGVLDAANVLLSRDYPNGQLVPIDQNYGTSSVRWRRWDIARSDGGTFSSANGQQLSTKGWTNNPPLTNADDIVPGRENAPYQFMSPYPASLFKLLIAYRVMRLVDAGNISLAQSYFYPTTRETRSIQGWLEPMIAYSDNTSTRALLKMLHDMNQVGVMNAEFKDLGLGTLQINDTDPATGDRWQPGQIHMTALDTARLLWLIEGASDSRPLWRKPNGKFVTSSELSNGSRSYLKGLLARQGYNEVLSTSNFCKAPNTLPGIPAPVPDEWINQTDGTVTVDGIPYGQDVRPCNATAEVSFAHKTGLTFNYGSDAGIVQSLPGKPYRHYVIALIANLGYRYTDPVFAGRTSFPCFDAVGGICYTQRIPAVAKQIDSNIQ
jgi:hypothetical protein